MPTLASRPSLSRTTPCAVSRAVRSASVAACDVADHGRRVKVVLGAATWRRPHVVILDEPTNYLDRESLAALIEALKVYEGGVLIITHNREFSESICSEVWAMRDGNLVASGHNWVEGQGSGERIDKKADVEEEHFDVRDLTLSACADALGNGQCTARVLRCAC